MIYCPHCNRPSARETGPCPHCGKDLGGAGTPPAARRPAAPAQPERSRPAASAARTAAKPPAAAYPSVVGGGGVELDLAADDEGAESGLELADDDDSPIESAPAAFDGGGALDLDADGEDGAVELETISPPERPAARAAPAEEPTDRPIDAREVGLASGFGTPAPGPIGAVKYALRVYGRLKELAREHEQALRANASAEQRRLAIAAELGRQAHEAGAIGAAAQKLVARALAADSDVVGAEQRRKGLESEHRAAVASLESEQARIEQEATPLRERVAILAHDLEQHRTNVRRVEAQLKRAQIELRNLKELIEARQQAYADQQKPKEERERLLADIADFDKRQPGIRQRIGEHEQELAEARAPVPELEARLAGAEEQLNDKLGRIGALQQERADLISGFEAARGQVAGQIEDEAAQAASAWARVGERVLADEAADGPLADLGSALSGAQDRAREARRKLEVLELARDSYDQGKVQQAKIIAAVAGLLVVGLIVAVGVALS